LYPKKFEAALIIIINMNCFLSSKSSYYYDFWRIMGHWRLE